MTGPDPPLARLAQILDAAATEIDALTGDARRSAEQRLGVPAGDRAVLDDPAYDAVLDLGLRLAAIAAAARQAATTSDDRGSMGR